MKVRSATRLREVEVRGHNNNFHQYGGYNTIRTFIEVDCRGEAKWLSVIAIHRSQRLRHVADGDSEGNGVEGSGGNNNNSIGLSTVPLVGCTNKKTPLWYTLMEEVVGGCGYQVIN